MPNILIVEDHKDYRQAVKKFLEIQHVTARIREASSGEQGVDMAHRIKPELVIMDYWLGGMNGLEAASQIKADQPATAIIMLTFFNQDEIKSAGIKKYVNAFVNKSDLDGLTAVVQKLIRS